MKKIQSLDLSGRTQGAVMDGEISSHCNVLSGVRQGSNFGPMLFLILIVAIYIYTHNDVKEWGSMNLRPF